MRKLNLSLVISSGDKVRFNRESKIAACLLIIISCCYSAVRGPNYDDIRALGMGNTTVPVTTDRTALFHNPAGLALVKDKVQFSCTPLAFAIDGVFFSLLGEMVEHGDKLGDLDKVDEDFLDMIDKFDGEWVGFEYIPEISFAAKNMGFGIYSVFPIGVRIESGHVIPKLAIQGQRDLVFAWGIGLPLFGSDKHFGGISLEYLQRTPVKTSITGYAETFKLFEQISDHPLSIIGDYSDIQHGFSFDVGFMHNILKGFRLAWDVKDLVGIVGGKFVEPPQVDLGCAYYFPQLEKNRVIRTLIAGIEFSNVFGVEPTTGLYEQFAKKIHIGAEIDMHYAAIRLGISQGYPTVGLGLRYGMFKADYSFFTEEQGYYAGQFPKKKHLLAFGIEINTAEYPPRKTRVTPAGLYNQAMNLYSKGRYYDAFFIYGRILTQFPDFFRNDWVHLYLSLCQEQMNMRKHSIVNYKKTKRDNVTSPVIPHADLGLMRIYYRNGDSSRVAKQFAILNKKGVPDSLRYHACYYQGQAHLHLKEPKKAIQVLKLIPESHQEHIFAQHSIAVAYAQQDSLYDASDVLFRLTQIEPQTREQKEIINRSYVFLGYLYYETHRKRKNALLNAVTMLRKVPDNSFYFEDALLGLAWCGISAGQWAHCLKSCDELKKITNKPALHYEAVLLEAYVKLIQKKYKGAIEILSQAEEEMKGIKPPSENKKSAATLDYVNTRKKYNKVAARVNKTAFSKYNSTIRKRSDSLSVPQAEHENKLSGIISFLDDFKRRSFFARNLQNVRDDIEYAHIKAVKIKDQESRTSTLKEAAKKAKQIDKEVDKLQEELKDLDEEKKKEEPDEVTPKEEDTEEDEVPSEEEETGEGGVTSEEEEKEKDSEEEEW